jgi:predicted phage-related endonuclease
MKPNLLKRAASANRRYFIGGSDARIIMGNDEAALLRLWREKRSEIEPEDLSGNLIVQLGLATENLNRRWYQAQTGRVVTDVQMWRRHPTLPWMAATLDGRVEDEAAVVILGRRGGREVYAAATAQHVCRGGPRSGAFGDHRWRQMG